MVKAKLARVALIVTFVLGMGTVASFADGDEDFSGYETPMAEQMANLPDNFFEPSMPDNIAASPVDNFSGYEVPMAEQMRGLPANFSPSIAQEPAYLADQGDLLEQRMNSVAATLPKTGIPDASGALKGGDYWKADEQLSRSEIKVENQITGYLKQQTALLKDENISPEDFASGMQALDTKLAIAHQEMINLENKAPFNQEGAVQADIARENKLVNDYKALAQGWADGGAVRVAGDDAEGFTGRRSSVAPPGGSGNVTVPQSTAPKADINAAQGGIWEDPATAAYYPKPPKLTYPSQQPAPAAPALEGTSETIRQFVDPTNSLQQQPVPAAPNPESSTLNKVGNAVSWPFEGTWASWPFGSKETAVEQQSGPVIPTISNYAPKETAGSIREDHGAVEVYKGMNFAP